MKDNPQFEYIEAVYDVTQNSARQINKSDIFTETIETDSEQMFKIYPNPTRNYITLQYDCSMPKLRYAIIDAQGKEVISAELESFESKVQNEILIGLDKLYPANYQLIIYSNNNVLWTETIIVTE